MLPRQLSWPAATGSAGEKRAEIDRQAMQQHGLRGGQTCRLSGMFIPPDAYTAGKSPRSQRLELGPFALPIPVMLFYGAAIKTHEYRAMLLFDEEKSTISRENRDVFRENPPCKNQVLSPRTFVEKSTLCNATVILAS